MKKSLTINATRNGKKVSKSFGYVNPEVANSLVGGFAQMVNDLTNDTFVNSEVVKTMDTNEQEQSSGGGNAKTAPTLSLGSWSKNGKTYSASISYNGDGNLTTSLGGISNGTLTVTDDDGIFSGTVSASEGTNYAAAQLNFSFNTESAQAGFLSPNLRITGSHREITWEGGGSCYQIADERTIANLVDGFRNNAGDLSDLGNPIDKGDETEGGFYILKADGNYSNAWLIL